MPPWVLAMAQGGPTNYWENTLGQLELQTVTLFPIQTTQKIRQVDEIPVRADLSQAPTWPVTAAIP